MDKKWNLQDIKPVQNRKKRVPEDMRPRRQPAPNFVENDDDGTMHIGVTDSGKKRRFGAMTIGVVLVVIFGGIFAVSLLTSGADISVYPRNQQPNINAEFTAYRVPKVDELSYEIMILEADGERQVTAKGEEEVTSLATGKLTISKNTPDTQRLIKNTRFESASGLIYRTTETVVVPGAVNGSPGTVQADVFADEVGDAHNTASGSFTVPGLKDDPALFKAITATVAEPITGGFSGKKFIIDDAELKTAKQALQMELRNALLERIPKEKPAGFVVFDDAVTITYESLPAIEYGQNLATIKEKALLQIPMFKDEQFAMYIAAASIPGYEKRPVRIDNNDQFTFAYKTATTSSSNIANQDSLTFKLVGKPKIVWTFDQGKLQADLVGAPKTALPSILSGYPAIEKAEAVIRPFWKRSFPSTMEKMTVTEIIDKPKE